MTSISSLTAPGYGMLGQIIADSTNVHRDLDTLTGQASSGLIANTYAGLGSGATVSLNLQPRLDSLQTWQNNIDATATRMQVTQTAMSQLQQIASTFNAQLMSLNGLSVSDVDNIAADARDALSQVTNLLDTQDGGLYVFAGQDTANPPVPNPNNILTSGFYTQISSAVAGLATNGAAATASTTLSVAASNASGTSPFSAYMSHPASSLQPPVVQTGDGVFQPVGLLASANTSIASTGGSTTGSYMRDLLRSLATIGSLSGTQAAAPGFADLVQDTRTCLTGAVTAMAGDTGVFGDTQAQLATLKTVLGETATAVTGQVSNAQDVDMAATLSRLTQVQTQLQASYQLITTLNGMSLVKFLPAA